ncbi:MAG: hypothetical protein JOZ41_04295, partial [Chloroflexi bacterium]|nr:hypothetical protein [Chloroflexota bacterium]
MAEDYENYAAMEEQAREALSRLEEGEPHALDEDRLAAGALILPGFDFDAGETYFNVILGELDTETGTFGRFVSPFAAVTLDDALGLARVTLTWLTEGRWPPRREQF